ncbi:MAG: hypothetical protein ACRERV_01035 [Methylococcales bacterium]
MKNQIESFQIILKRLLCINALLTGLLIAPAVSGHGGASVKIDSCRIPVAGNNWVHFTAYTPTFTADTEYCNSIPQAGPTNLVFDYENKQLRAITVQFEITKEPEGERVYFQPAQTRKTGTVNAAIDFGRFGEGDYLTHVTLVIEGKQIDAHLPFSVGGASGVSIAGFTIALVTILGLLVVFFRVPALRGRLAGISRFREKRLGV